MSAVPCAVLWGRAVAAAFPSEGGRELRRWPVAPAPSPGMWLQLLFRGQNFGSL